jgi:CheY-like chemotaxis protein
MDVQMPRMDGMSAARELRRRGRTSLPIIAMTAHAFAEDRAACLAAGMNDHLAKPVDPRTLYALLLRWLPAPAPALAAGPSDEGRRAPLMQRLAQVEGLEPTVGLRSLGGNEVMLERILWRFVQLYRAGCPALRDAGLDRPESRSQESAHSVCGACYTIGAVGLGDQLRALENALREGGHDPALLTMEGGRLEEELIKLADDLQEALGCEETAAAATPPSDAAGRRVGASSAA